MHRKTTHVAHRVSRLTRGLDRGRIGKSIERRGIVATYTAHDRVLSNRASRRLYEQSPPALDDTQRSLVDAIDAEGYATIPFVDLLGDEDLWHAIDSQGQRFASETAAALEREASGEVEPALRRRAGKEFVVRLNSYGVELGGDDPWLRACMSRRLLDVANAYARMWTKLEYIDVWYSVPQPESKGRISSQNWHRDYNDRRLLKAFLYLVDVDEETGPFEYVAGSAGHGPYAAEWPWRPLGENYPSTEEFERRIPSAAVRTFTAPQGTLVLCDTSGFHRGGFAKAKARVLATATYCSPASLKSLTTRNFELRDGSEGLDPVTRYAVT